MRIEHQLRAFEKILAAYNGAFPLHRFLPSYFKLNKQMGSSDRRWASRYLYNYFRLGSALASLDTEMRLAIADFLCEDSLSLVVEKNLPEWSTKLHLEVIEKVALVKARFVNFNLEDVFPNEDLLSESIDKDEFYTSFFTQPDLFIRIDETDKHQIGEKLEQGGVSYKTLSPTTISLPNGTKLETILQEGSYQVQDLSSQYTGSYFQPNKWDKWWDCCAASGGKTLLLHSLEPGVNLLVSDLRETILNNLDERFRLAGIKKYQKKELDLLQNNDQILHHYEFDGIILDAPCTGSGTWGRTPEMLTYFQRDKISQFSAIQKKIVTNVIKYLKINKPLIYITCSVFKGENEGVVKYMLDHLPLKLEKMELVKGYNKRADTMFVARLVKLEN